MADAYKMNSTLLFGRNILFFSNLITEIDIVNYLINQDDE